MLNVLVCIPTVPARQPYLINCARAYERGTETWDPDRPVTLNFSLVHDAQTAGEGWQRCVEQGLDWFPESTHIHFSNDDVAVARGWLRPLVEACDAGFVPAMRIEPAGGHIEKAFGVQVFQTHPPMPPDYTAGVPRDPVAYFFAGLPHEQPTVDGQLINHANLPFCTVEMWREIGPFPPIHYGSDRWFAERARAAGYETVAKLDSVAFNFNANIGRAKGGWLEQDILDFDGVFALPAYLSGELDPHEPHPLRLTMEGLTLVREWRKQHVAAEVAMGLHQ